MNYYATAEERGRLVAGLRELAAFLECRLDVPAPKYAHLLVFPLEGTDTEQREEIDTIASRIDTQAYESTPGHYVASRFFGPVEYRAIAIDHETSDNAEGV